MMKEWIDNTKKLVEPVLAVYLLVYLFQLNIQIWTPILTPVMPHAATSTSSLLPFGDEQIWKLDDKTVHAHHVTSTAPAYGGDRVWVAGHDADDKVIWSYGGIATMVRIR